MKKKFIIQYLSVMGFISVIVLLATYFYITYDNAGILYTRIDWIETFTGVVLFYFIIPSLSGFLNLKKILKNSRESQIHKLPIYSILSILPGYLLWNIIFCIPEALMSEEAVTAAIKINIILVLSYIYVIFPLFISYMLISRITKTIKSTLFITIGMQFHPGNTKLWQKFLIMIVITTLFPISILYLDGYINFDKTLGNHRRILSSIDLALVIITTTVSIIIVSKDITDPIKVLLKSFRTILKGDFSHRIPVTALNEIGYLTHSFNQMASGLEDREKIKNVFGQYVSHAIADKILDKHGVLDGEEREVTVLFTDIEGYTSLSETLTPTENILILNQYYKVLISIIKNYGGTINKFIGDSIMVIFNAPVDDINHQSNAINCARSIINKTNNTIFSKDIKLKTRIGINTGMVVAGKVGGMDRFEYTIIGDTVNIAQKLEQLNKKTGTQVLIGQSTTLKLNTNELIKLGRTNIEGRKDTVGIYTLECHKISQ